MCKIWPSVLRIILSSFAGSAFAYCPLPNEPPVDFSGLSGSAVHARARALAEQAYQNFLSYADCIDAEGDEARERLRDDSSLSTSSYERQVEELTNETDRLYRSAKQRATAYRDRVNREASDYLAKVTQKPQVSTSQAQDPAKQTSAASAPRCVAVRTRSDSVESVYLVQNTCAFPIVVYYCVVSNEPPQTDVDGFDCRRQGDQRLLPNRKVVVSSLTQNAPRTRQDLRTWTNEQIQFYEDLARKGHTATEGLGPAEIARTLRTNPTSWYSLPGGSTHDTYIKASTTYNRLRQKIFLSACPLSEYEKGKCIPDSIQFWRDQGRPQSP
jgi:hypothetical protein